MSIVFVILRIGERDVDRLYKDAIEPAIAECKLQPICVAPTEGHDTINSRILELINNSQIVIADLTYERPNCYFEAGYTQGKGIPIIYLARKDHDPRLALRADTSPKVHFDLDSYKITYWAEDELDSARVELSQRIPAIINSTPRPPSDPKLKALHELILKTVTVSPSRFNEPHLTGATTCEVIEVNDNYVRLRRQANGKSFSVPTQDVKLTTDEKQYRPKLLLSKFLEDF